MTLYKNFIADFGFRIQKYPYAPNLSKIKPISWKICKFLHFSIPEHIHDIRLPWQHLRLMRIVVMCKMTPISAGLNLENFILIPCAVLELLRKVSQGGGFRSPPPPPGEIGLKGYSICTWHISRVSHSESRVPASTTSIFSYLGHKCCVELHQQYGS